MLILLWLWKMCFARAVLPMSPPSGMAVRVCRASKLMTTLEARSLAIEKRGTNSPKGLRLGESKNCTMILTKSYEKHV